MQLTVACGSGAVRLLELQRAGKKPMAAAEFLARISPGPGTRFSGPEPPVKSARIIGPAHATTLSYCLRWLCVNGVVLCVFSDFCPSGLSLLRCTSAPRKRRPRRPRASRRGPIYGAIVTIEHGVRVYRPVPPTQHLIINPDGARRCNSNIGNGAALRRTRSRPRARDRSALEGTRVCAARDERRSAALPAPEPPKASCPATASLVEYDGTPFLGWQRQAQGTSVQGALEDALFQFCGEAASVRGAGRTDAGVHALGQVAHFDLAKTWEPFRVREAVNFHLRPAPVVGARLRGADDFRRALQRHGAPLPLPHPVAARAARARLRSCLVGAGRA